MNKLQSLEAQQLLGCIDSNSDICSWYAHTYIISVYWSKQKQSIKCIPNNPLTNAWERHSVELFCLGLRIYNFTYKYCLLFMSSLLIGVRIILSAYIYAKSIVVVAMPNAVRDDFLAQVESFFFFFIVECLLAPFEHVFLSCVLHTAFFLF